MEETSKYKKYNYVSINSFKMCMNVNYLLILCINKSNAHKSKWYGLQLGLQPLLLPVNSSPGSKTCLPQQTRSQAVGI